MAEDGNEQARCEGYVRWGLGERTSRVQFVDDGEAGEYVRVVPCG